MRNKSELRKLRKAKERRERLRRERHERLYGSGLCNEEEPADDLDGLDDEPEELAFQPPSFTIMERMLRKAARASRGQGFSSAEEHAGFLRGQALLDRDEPLDDPKEEAQELAYKAIDASTREEAVDLARQALALDPDSVDALRVMALATADTPEVRIAALRKAVEVGERSLGAELFDLNRGHFWGIVETRPYMRAREDLANALREHGKEAEAIKHFEAMLELNPNDNQGVRDTLLGLYLAREDGEGARRLLERYKEDCSAVSCWGKFLERLLAGDKEGSILAFQDAMETNPYVDVYLRGERPLPDGEPSFYSLGQPTEAHYCLTQLGPAFLVVIERRKSLLAEGPS